MSIGKKEVVVMMCMAVGAMISSCGSKGNSNEAVTRGARVNPVVNSGRSAISSPVVKGREIEVNPLVAKIDKEMERVGAYRAASDAIMEGKVNRALNEGQDKIGMQEIDVREIEEALKEVEKMEEGRRKEVLKLFFQRAKSHCKGQRESFSAWGDRKGGSCQGQAYISHEIWNKELHKIEAERMNEFKGRKFSARYAAEQKRLERMWQRIRAAAAGAEAGEEAGAGEEAAAADVDVVDSGNLVLSGGL